MSITGASNFKVLKKCFNSLYRGELIFGGIGLIMKTDLDILMGKKGDIMKSIF